MQVPLQIRYRNLDRSAAIDAAIEKRMRHLEKFADRITSCRITVAAPHKHHHKGNLYQIAIDIRTPMGEVVVSRSPDQRHAHEDVYVAIRDAFDAARRQLQDLVRETRGKVKVHDAPPHGRVTEKHPDDDYGRITDSTGREVYFHRNSIVNAKFDDLSVGTEVRFVEEAGEHGPQASSVHLIGKHHIVD